MASATMEMDQIVSGLDPYLMKASVTAVQEGLQMCDVKARCVGMSAIPSHEPGLITGMIGVHGNVSGFVTVNIADQFAFKVVEGLLGDHVEKITAQVVDGVGELTNIIVGGVKKGLSGTPWAFSNITVPSVIVGRGYSIAYSKGLSFLCATFEHLDSESVMLQDRMLHISISLLRL